MRRHFYHFYKETHKGEDWAPQLLEVHSVNNFYVQRLPSNSMTINIVQVAEIISSPYSYTCQVAFLIYSCNQKQRKNSCIMASAYWKIELG